MTGESGSSTPRAPSPGPEAGTRNRAETSLVNGNVHLSVETKKLDSVGRSGQALSNGLFRVTVHSLAHAGGRPIIATRAAWDEAEDKLFDRLTEKAE